MDKREINITVSLDLGNDEAAQQTRGLYVGNTVKAIGRRIVEEHFASDDYRGSIRDGNGNTIGEWQIEGDMSWQR